MKRYLILSDGTVYEGEGFGAASDTAGELVFTTNMNGYTETLTDPSYAGQIVMCTFPLIGNYGMNHEDEEGKPYLHGFVVREYCDEPSNFRCETTVDAFLKEHGIPGIYGIDTRALTRKLREFGVMNAKICSEIPADLSDIVSYEVKGVVPLVSCKEKTEFPAANEKYHVVLIDYGYKRNIVRELQKRGCRVTVVPQDTSAAEVLSLEPDGIMLSNGPGDPAENIACIEVLKQLIGKKPVFGICLGHQLISLAKGYKTYKMKYGHRGGNQPVKDLVTGKTYITTQNHGYAVEMNDSARFVNVSDGTCEGIDDTENMCFSVQFHPEACAGPKDTSFLFDRFTAMMEDYRNAER